MKTILSCDQVSTVCVSKGSGRLRAMTLAVAGLLSISAHGQFTPGSGGSVPNIPPLVGVANQIPGLMVVQTDRQNNFFGGGTQAMLDLSFPAPSVHGASGYRLQRSPGASATWEDHPWGYDGFLETSSSSQGNFSFTPDTSYSYRLLVQGGTKNGYVSNVVSADISGVETRFASWGMDESMYISGVMMPWLGRGLTASFTVRKLSDDSDVADGLTYQWYRVNPVSGEMTAISGATGLTYITTEDDLGGYHHICRATGNGTTVGGYIQARSSGGVVVPNNSYFSELASNGFRLNLHKSVPSLVPADLNLTYWDGAEQKTVSITGVTASEGNASFWIAAAIPTGVQQLTLDNVSDIWGLGEEIAPGHFMQSLQIPIPTEGFAPEIAVENASEAALTDGSGSQVFGKILVGKTGAATTFSILNTGKANLTGLAISKNGSHAADFIVSGLSANSLAPDGVATFTITFKPTAAGARTCAIHITSNDADENPFDIVLAGMGVAPAPEIVVQQPAGQSLVDNESKKDYRTVKVGGNSIPKVFTIKNTGTAALKGLAVKVGGPHAKDFVVTVPAKTQLAPGASTTFKVTFKPKAKGTRKGALRILSNDADENPFDVVLSGQGK